MFLPSLFFDSVIAGFACAVRWCAAVVEIRALWPAAAVAPDMPEAEDLSWTEATGGSTVMDERETRANESLTLHMNSFYDWPDIILGPTANDAFRSLTFKAPKETNCRRILTARSLSQFSGWEYISRAWKWCHHVDFRTSIIINIK